MLAASSWGCYSCCGQFIGIWGTPLCWLSYQWNGLFFPFQKINRWPAGTVSFPRKSGRFFKQQNLSSSLERFSQSNHSYVRSPHNISKISIIRKFILRWMELHFSFSIFPSVYSCGLQVKRSFGPKELDEDTRLDQEWTCLRFLILLLSCVTAVVGGRREMSIHCHHGLMVWKPATKRAFCDVFFFPVFLFVSVVFFVNCFWARVWVFRVNASPFCVLTHVDWKPSWKKISTSVTTVAYYGILRPFAKHFGIHKVDDFQNFLKNPGLQKCFLK